MIASMTLAVLACSHPVPAPWELQQGEFTLRMELPGQRPFEGNGTLSLHSKTKGGIAWSIPHEYVYPGEVVLSQDGQHVALLNKYWGVIRFLDAQGKSDGRVDIAFMLTDDEVGLLPTTTCGREYFEWVGFQDSNLIVYVSLDGFVRRDTQSPRQLKFRVDPKARKAERLTKRAQPDAGRAL